MGKLIIHQERIIDKDEFIKLCPFHALEITGEEVLVTAGCKMCKLCVKKAENGEIEYLENEVAGVDKSGWNGICVYVDHEDGDIHPVTFELVGKAIELAKKAEQKVYCLFIGSEIKEKAQKLLYYGVDEIFVYDDPKLRRFQIEPYTAVFADFIYANRPSVVLVGATATGRQLAPRVAARFKTGLTADCTVLDINENADLVQIRPAFGGNIMAQILTPNHRPQMATVRYKVMDAPSGCGEKSGVIRECAVHEEMLRSNMRVLNVSGKQKVKTIEAADVIVVAGRGVKTKEDLAMVSELAELLGGELAATRPMIEAGWVDAKRQVGLSGRTVRPKLIITCGVSGAVQFTAGMKSSERIFAINKDEKAPIFKVAHYGIVGDIYDVIPNLIEKLKQERGLCGGL